jgi:hypothetical protein
MARFQQPALHDAVTTYLRVQSEIGDDDIAAIQRGYDDVKLRRLPRVTHLCSDRVARIENRIRNVNQI